MIRVLGVVSFSTERLFSAERSSTRTTLIIQKTRRRDLRRAACVLSPPGFGGVFNLPLSGSVTHYRSRALAEAFHGVL